MISDLYSIDGDSTIIQTPFNTKIITPVYRNIVTPVFRNIVPFTPIIQLNTPFIRYTTSVNFDSSYYAQKETAKWARYRVLDYWLFEEEFDSIYKYMKIEDNIVKIITSKSEYDSNKESANRDPEPIRQMKSDYIGNNLLTKDDIRDLIHKFLSDHMEIGHRLHWSDIPDKKNPLVEKEFVMAYVKKYLKKRLESRLN